METINSVIFKLRQTPSAFSTAITAVGALDSGSITPGFGSINIGTDALTAGAGSFTTLTASAATNLDAGTVSAPGLYLEGETGTGLYRIGANNHGYAVSGAKVLDIASTGLSVTGTTSTTQGITSGSVGGTLGSVALKGTTSGTATITTDVTATKVTADKPIEASSFVPTSSTVPTNGVFLGAANSVSIATNSAEHWMVNASGNLNPVGSKGIGSGAAPVSEVVSGTLALTGYIEGTEQVAPSAPAANKFRLFAQDNGAGKTQLMVQFATGVAIQLAIEA